MVMDEIDKAPNSRMTRHIRTEHIHRDVFWLSLLRSESKDIFFRGLVLLLLLDPASVLFFSRQYDCFGAQCVPIGTHSEVRGDMPFQREQHLWESLVA